MQSVYFTVSAVTDDIHHHQHSEQLSLFTLRSFQFNSKDKPR